MDILYRPRVEATEQMTHNRTFRNPIINESAKSRVSDIYVVVVSCSRSILHLKSQTKGTYALNLLLLLLSILCQCSSENVWNKCLKCFFSPNLYYKWIGQCFGRYVLLLFVFQWMFTKWPKFEKFFCKQYVSTGQILKSLDILWLFCKLQWLLSLSLLE